MPANDPHAHDGQASRLAGHLNFWTGEFTPATAEAQAAHAEAEADRLCARQARRLSAAEARAAGREGEEFWATADEIADAVLKQCSDAVPAAYVSDAARDALSAELERRGIACD